MSKKERERGEKERLSHFYAHNKGEVRDPFKEPRKEREKERESKSSLAFYQYYRGREERVN